MLLAVIHGFILSFGLILPLGAQNIFIFNQGARSRHLTGALPSILTASLSDTLLIFLAVAGVSLVILSFPWLQSIFLAAGLIFLVRIGFSIWKDSSEKRENHSPRLTVKNQMIYALSVSILNPHAVLDTIGVIGTNALHYSGSIKWAFAAACASVSWLWFFGLALTGHLTGKMDQGGRVLVIINRLSALMIWLIALYIAAILVQTLL